MKNYTKMFAPVLLAILIGSLTFIFAQSKDESSVGKQRPPRGEGFGPPPGMRGGIPPHVIEQLNLTDAQKEQIQAIESYARDASKEFFDKIRTADEQLRTMLDGGNFNESATRQILITKSQAMVETELVQLRTFSSILKILTADQKAQLEQLKQQRLPMLPQNGFRPND